MIDQSYYQMSAGNLYLQCRIQPGSQRNEIFGVLNHHLKIRIQAPAHDNKANKELILYLSQFLGISKSSILILKGEKNRDKLLKITTSFDLELLKSAVSP